WQPSETPDPVDDTVVVADADAGADAGADAEQSSSANAFLVHAIGRNERGLTFYPQSLVQGKLLGISDLLGECSIAVSDINQLLFGPDVYKLARAYRDDPWTLSLAQLPRVY